MNTPNGADERRVRFALAHVVEPGDRTVAAELATWGPAGLWDRVSAPGSESRWAGRAARFDADRAMAATRAAGARFVVPGDPEWPTGLGALVGCEPVQDRGGLPLGLWVRGRGDLGRASGAGVALVGSRAATAYGEQVASGLAYDLAARGVPVVSGAAYGIDGAAHRGALAGWRDPDGAATVAILACGVDRVYPVGHADLLDRIAESGLVVSELPPGEHPTRLRFLARNRLIAALSRATVVVEAGVRSGARNTATWAVACGRHLLAVPGPVTSALSATPHRLLRDHEAELAADAADVMALISPVGQDALCGESEPPDPLDLLDDGERQVFEALPGSGSMVVDEISVAAALPVSVCLGELVSLQDRGLVVETRSGGWQLTHRHRRKRVGSG